MQSLQPIADSVTPGGAKRYPKEANLHPPTEGETANHHSNYGKHTAVAVTEAKVLHECNYISSLLSHIL